jgi:RNA-binding protein
MTAIQLTPAERKEHRSSAHHLDPVVMIGGEGLTPAVSKEIDHALNAHGLIKVRVFSDDRPAREAMLQTWLTRWAPRPSSTSASCWCCGGRFRPKRDALPAEEPQGLPGPRTVKLVSFSKSGTHRAQSRKSRSLATSGVTSGGQVKRVPKSAPPAAASRRSSQGA